jgi:hypothetical protein
MKRNTFLALVLLALLPAGLFAQGMRAPGLKAPPAAAKSPAVAESLQPDLFLERSANRKQLTLRPDLAGIYAWAAPVANADGTSSATLTYVANGEISEPVTYTISIKVGPTPVPPVPPVPPEPPVPPVPVPGKLHVLFLYESGDLPKMPIEQVSVLASKPIRDYLTTHCDKDGNVPTFKFVDRTSDLDLLPQDWQEIVKRGEGKTLPWMIVANANSGSYEGPWPATTQATLELLKKYGGQ